MGEQGKRPWGNRKVATPGSHGNPGEAGLPARKQNAPEEGEWQVVSHRRSKGKSLSAAAQADSEGSHGNPGEAGLPAGRQGSQGEPRNPGTSVPMGATGPTAGCTRNVGVDNAPEEGEWQLVSHRRSKGKSLSAAAQADSEGSYGNPGEGGLPARRQGSQGEPRNPGTSVPTGATGPMVPAGCTRNVGVDNAPEEGEWQVVSHRRSKRKSLSAAAQGDSEAGAFLYTNENTNYFRLITLLYTWGTLALRMVLDSAIGPDRSLLDVLQELKPIFTDLRSQGILTTRQWVKFYPVLPSAVSSTKLDITDMMLIFRNADLLPSPSKGWDCLPPRNFLSKEADIVRVRVYRNELAHSVNVSISDGKFEKYWTEIQDALDRLLEGKYRAKIAELKTRSTDPQMEKQLLEEIDKLTLQEVESPQNKGTGDHLAVELSKTLKTNRIVKLDMSNRDIGDRGAAALAESFHVNNVLDDLDLSGNAIGDFGAKQIARALRSNPSIKYLDLSRNKIGKKGAFELMEAFEKNSVLKRLHLSDNKYVSMLGIPANISVDLIK